jgi:hypothetical protein
MKLLRRALAITLVLGGLSVLALVVSVLALIDIGQGEPDVALEWNVLRASFFIILLFQVSALATVGKVFRVMR